MENERWSAIVWTSPTWGVRYVEGEWAYPPPFYEDTGLYAFKTLGAALDWIMKEGMSGVEIWESLGQDVQLAEMCAWPTDDRIEAFWNDPEQKMGEPGPAPEWSVLCKAIKLTRKVWPR